MITAKGKPIIIEDLSDEHLRMMYDSVNESINKLCDECTPPPEVFQLLQNVTAEMESRKLI